MQKGLGLGFLNMGTSILVLESKGTRIFLIRFLQYPTITYCVFGPGIEYKPLQGVFRGLSSGKK